jgi:hypothetical protein
LLEATCTGIGTVTLANTLPAHTEAVHVAGSNTVVLVPFNAPGIIRAGRGRWHNLHVRGTPAWFSHRGSPSSGDFASRPSLKMSRFGDDPNRRLPGNGV